MKLERFSLILFSFLISFHSLAAKSITTEDGISLRYLHLTPSTHETKKKGVVILQGMGAFIEKYDEFSREFTSRGYHVWIFDWRGQGGSTRPINHPRKYHIDSFDQHLNDLSFFIKKVVAKEKLDFCLLFGNSMGGHLAARFLQENKEHVFDAAILEAPMFDINTGSFPKALVQTMSFLACRSGFATSYAVGYGDDSFSENSFDTNTVTHDPIRFENYNQLCKEKAHLTSGGMTWGWVHAALSSIERLHSEDLSHINIPILIQMAGKDSFVVQRYDLLTKFPKVACRLYPHAKHNIAMEKESIRSEFIKDIFHFLEHHNS